MNARTVYNIVAFGAIVFCFSLAFAALRFIGYGFATSVMLALGWAVVSLGLAASVAQLVAPSLLIKWRRKIVAAQQLFPSAKWASGSFAGGRVSATVGLALFFAAALLLVRVAGPLATWTGNT